MQPSCHLSISHAPKIRFRERIKVKHNEMIGADLTTVFCNVLFCMCFFIKHNIINIPNMNVCNESVNQNLTVIPDLQNKLGPHLHKDSRTHSKRFRNSHNRRCIEILQLLLNPATDTQISRSVNESETLRRG